MVSNIYLNNFWGFLGRVFILNTCVGIFSYGVDDTLEYHIGKSLAFIPVAIQTGCNERKASWSLRESCTWIHRRLWRTLSAFVRSKQVVYERQGHSDMRLHAAFTGGCFPSPGLLHLCPYVIAHASFSKEPEEKRRRRRKVHCAHPETVRALLLLYKTSFSVCYTYSALPACVRCSSSWPNDTILAPISYHFFLLFVFYSLDWTRTSRFIDEYGWE